MLYKDVQAVCGCAVACVCALGFGAGVCWIVPTVFDRGKVETLKLKGRQEFVPRNVADHGKVTLGKLYGF